MSHNLNKLKQVLVFLTSILKSVGVVVIMALYFLGTINDEKALMLLILIIVVSIDAKTN